MAEILQHQYKILLQILTEFPREIQADICMHIYRSLLSLPVFSEACRDCLRMISLDVKKVSVTPGELLIKREDAIQSVYFVQRGMLEIVQQDFIVAIIGEY